MQTFILDEAIHFRLRYRNEIRFLIADIVKSAIPPDQAEKRINDNAQRLPEGDQERFSSAPSRNKNVTQIRPVGKIGDVIPANIKALLKEASPSDRNSGRIAARREVLLNKINQIGDLLKENDGIRAPTEIGQAIKVILEK
ncbi:hypothetical protein [Chitinophaga ginsengisoli]|uniref:Uncharacterized protein n=1 Tax=Chitinophaga ginsengisoli TaxID=363837 RepID=A0A2P8G7N5_9BACT|nr:hypothetical protein [Chitinophaga ginsengisoli]PSL29980.1 hypothetical protein CLV42_106316 [Chitinophaga ginsengisoli]